MAFQLPDFVLTIVAMGHLESRECTHFVPICLFSQITDKLANKIFYHKSLILLD